MLPERAGGDADSMKSPASARADRPAVREHERISVQIRRFALLWIAASAGVLLFVAIASLLASSYRDDAGRRSRAATDAQLAVARLQASVQAQATDVLGYRLTGDSTYRLQYAADAATTQARLTELRQAARKAKASGAERALLSDAVSAIATWNDHVGIQFAGHSAGRGGASPPGTASEAAVPGIEKRLDQLEAALTDGSRTAIATTRHRAHIADLVRQAATLIGLIILFAGGVRLLRRAYTLAGEADARREREANWSNQIEAVLAWSVRAKSAATRSQLIGFAHMAPKDAIGVTCFMLTEGAAPSHRSHGQPRLAIEVDEAGDGLHVSVCFAPDRGDEHDHHALDLLLGHLAALWRTVLRQEELERAAGHDALTGLPNRRTFEAELRRRVGLSKRRGLGFTLAMIDLDHFKLVNDSFGHPEGDTVLRRSGEAIRGVLRGSDRVFRVGGEEFALMLETADRDGVTELLERAREAVKALGVEPSVGSRLSASIGWAVYPNDADERGELIAQADAALYRAKQSGRDRVVHVGDLQQSAA
jgi:diguanylate cyclase (GGDEF)-like protein